MSASDLEAILEDALRDRGHPTPMLEAQKLCFHLSRVAGGEIVRVPLTPARVVERQRRVQELGDLPAETVAKRIGCSRSTVYRDKQCVMPANACDTASVEDDDPKEGD